MGKTLNFNLLLKVFQRLDFKNFSFFVSLITWKIMGEKIGNGFGWEFEYFGFQIYLGQNSLLTIGKTLNFNLLLKVFQRLDFRKFSCLVFLITWQNMCEKFGNGFGSELQYFKFQIYLGENRLFTLCKTLNFNLLLKVFQPLFFKNFFCSVFLITWRIMCEKIGNGFKWEFEYFGFQINLCENSLLTIGKTLNFNSLLKVFQRFDFKNFLYFVFFITRQTMCENTENGFMRELQYFGF